MNNKINDLLNKQIVMEFEASQVYLKMATILEVRGYGGAAEFFYRQSAEERDHMMRIVRFINDRGGDYQMPEITPKECSEKVIRKPDEYLLHSMCEMSLNMEIEVSEHVNKIVSVCKEEHDYSTENFMQWFVNEQIEEEHTFSELVDKINIIGKNGTGLYLIDNEMSTLNMLKE